MMRRFGSWSQYRTAPRHVVEEQIVEWTASLDANADIHADPPKV